MEAKDRLIQARKAQNLTQNELAEMVGSSQPAIWKLEQGKTKLSEEWANRLSKVLNTTPEHLIFGIKDETGKNIFQIDAKILDRAERAMDEWAIKHNRVPASRLAKFSLIAYFYEVEYRRINGLAQITMEDYLISLED